MTAHLIVRAQVTDPGDKGAFDRWYQDEHLPQAVAAFQLRTVPGYTIAQLRAKRYSDHPEYKRLAEEYWYEGLRKAGLPES